MFTDLEVSADQASLKGSCASVMRKALTGGGSFRIFGKFAPSAIGHLSHSLLHISRQKSDPLERAPVYNFLPCAALSFSVLAGY